jgi:hypothetical protein
MTKEGVLEIIFSTNMDFDLLIIGPPTTDSKKRILDAKYLASEALDLKILPGADSDSS